MKIKGFMIKKGIQCLKDYGLRELWVRMVERRNRRKIPYDPWYQEQRINKEEWNRQREETAVWEMRPLVSICVPLYKTSETFLCEMIDSVRNQTYENWQLCLADGSPDETLEGVIAQHYPEEKRISYKHLEENLGIAENTNAAFELAEGEWIGLLDHDDILAPEALFESLSAVFKKGKETEAVYSDEDKITEDLQTHFDPHFKPDYNLDLLRSNNYITHFFMVKKSIVEEVGGFCKEYDGSQDYDFILRCTTKAKKVAHVPRILYHWRTSENSTAENPASKMYAFEAGKAAIEAHLKAEQIAAEVQYTKGLGFYRVKYQLTENSLVSILVLGKEQADRKSEKKKELVKKIPKYLEKTTYKNYEVLHVETSAQAIHACICQKAKGEYFVLIDENTEIVSADWLEELLSHCQRQEVASAGPKIILPNKKIWSAGQVLGGEALLNDVYTGLPSHYYGYMHRASTQINYSALSSICVMMKKSAYKEVGGLDETFSNMKWALLDLFLKLNGNGYLNVYTPFVMVCKRSKISRKQENLKQSAKNHEKEDMDCLLWKWRSLKEPDRNYNVNLSMEPVNYTLKIH